MVVEEKERSQEREKAGTEGMSLSEEEGIRLEKSNILILGPTGSGQWTRVIDLHTYIEKSI